MISILSIHLLSYEIKYFIITCYKSSYMTMICVSLLLIWLIGAYGIANAQDLRNVLMIIVDDLRPELEPYLGTDDSIYPNIQTPNINSLAEHSMIFRKAYTQFPICGPSRNSFMTGRRPDTTKVFINGDYWRETGGNFTSIPQYFKENGYVTYGSGKVYHGDRDNQYSWTENLYGPTTKDYWHADDLSWGMAQPEEFNNISLPDMQIKDYALEKLQQVAEGNDPFFIAVGFEKPHLPFLAPSIFFELYPENEISLPSNPHVPLNHPKIAWSYWSDMNAYNDTGIYDNSYNSTMPDFKTLELRRAYYAAVSYTDALIGEILQELENLNLADNTIVLLMSDHGYQLGEHAEWAKNTNFELDLHVPMILKVPGLTDGGRSTDAMVENVDVFPTLAELAGLNPLQYCPEDSGNIQLCHEGHSMADLLSEPYQPWKTATFSELIFSSRNPPAMGYTVATLGYRYVRWMNYVNETLEWGVPIDEELFDMVKDPNQLENVAGYQEYVDIQREMFEMLLLGWRGALPE